MGGKANKTQKFLIAFLISAVFLITIPPVPAFAGPIPIINLDSTGAECTGVNLTFTIDTCNQTGDIAVDGIVFSDNLLNWDGNGFKITGPGTGTGFEIDGVSNITIEHVEIDSFTNAIAGNDCSDVSVSKVDSSGTGTGIGIQLAD